jgi:hypothetical protein
MKIAELKEREIHPDDWVWITPEERDALVDAAEQLQRLTFGTNAFTDPTGVAEAKIDAASALKKFDFGDES